MVPGGVLRCWRDSYQRESQNKPLDVRLCCPSIKRGSAMEVEEIRGSGHHLAITAAFRMLVSRVAELAAPADPGNWFTALGQDTFDYVDRTTNRHYDDETM